MQKQVTQFSSECGKAKIYVETDMAIGLFHDFLMAIKGAMVDRMVEAHKQQVAQAQEMMQQPPHESELPSPGEELPPNPQPCASECAKE